jgi:hypothetical protein
MHLEISSTQMMGWKAQFSNVETGQILYALFCAFVLVIIAN